MFRRSSVWVLVGIALFMLINFSVGLEVISAHAAVAIHYLARNTPAAFTTPTPIPPQGGFFNFEDEAIRGAWITVLGAIIGAIIPTSFAIFQHRHVQALEKQRQIDEVTRQEKQREYEREMQRLHHEHEREMQQLHHEHKQEILQLRAEARAKEKEDERKDREEQEAQSIKEHDKALEDRVRIYCKALSRDPRISSIEMVGMSQPRHIESVYVPVQLYQIERKLDLDRSLREVEELRNPDILLGVEVEGLKNRFSGALHLREAISFYPHCIILGDPGAGKTTLLKYLALLSAENRLAQLPNLPIYIRLNAFALSGDGNLLNFAASQWEIDYGFPKDEARDYMETRLKAGSALLLLDALDETFIGNSDDEAEAYYKRVTTAIENLGTRYHQAPIVITARKAGYQQRPAFSLAGFTQLEVLGFRSEDITEFVNKWFKFDPNQPGQSKAIDLNKQLEGNPRIHTLAANPLLLSLIVLVYDAQRSLPDRHAELYKQCIDTLLYNWDNNRGIDRRHDFTIEHKQALLTEIAWHFHNKGRRYFPEDELLQIIEAFLPSIDVSADEKRNILAEIVTQNGLIKEQAWHLYGFLHLTLQEYFVAFYIEEHNKLDALLNYLGEPWWEEVVLLYAAQASDVNPLLQRLVSPDSEGQQREDIFQTNLILAGRCLIDRPSMPVATLQEEVIRRLFNVLSSTKYLLTREHCINVLVAIGGEIVNKQLLQMLTDEGRDQPTRYYIIETLGTSGERPIGTSLLQLLSNNTIDPALSEIIAEALGTLGDRTLARNLLGLLDSPRLEVDVRRSIAKSLGILGERSIVRTLVSYLTDTRIDLRVRCSIASALGILGERSIIRDLFNLLVDTHINSHVRCHIADAIGMMRQQTVAHDLLNLLIREEDDRIVCYHIAGAIGKSRDLSVLPQLRSLVKSEQIDLQVRKSIKVAIAQLGDQSVVPDLLDCLTDSDTDQYIRRSIVDVLAMFSDRSIISRLLPLLSDPHVNPYVRRGIVTVLMKLDGHAVYPKLLKLLASDRLDRSVRQSIAHALGKLGEHAVVIRLLELLNQVQDVYVRQSIVEALAILGDRSSVTVLRDMLTHEQLDPLLRQSIANTLGKLANDNDTVEALFALLSTTDIPDAIYRALWSVSRRAGVRVFPDHGSIVREASGA